MLKISKYMNLEGLFVITNHLSIIYTCCSSSAPRYMLATLNLALSIIYLFAFLTHKNNQVNKSTYFMPMLLFALSVLLSSIEQNSAQFRTSYLGLLSYALFGVSTYIINYVYLQRNKTKAEIIKYYAYASMALGAITAYYFYNFTMKTLSLDSSGDVGQNFFYYFIIPMPLLFCFLDDKKKMALYLMVFMGVLLSFKRSGFIIMIIVGFFMILNIFKKKKDGKGIKNKTLYIFIAIICSLVLLNEIGFEKIEAMQGRIEAIEEDEGSGRLTIAGLFFKYLPEYQIHEYLFGHGYGGFMDKFVYYNSAHNDFIEVFFAHGIFGLLAIIIIMTRTIKKTIQYRKTTLYIPLLTLSTFFIVFGMVSSIYRYYNFSLPIFVLLAYLDYQFTNKKNV